MTDPQNGRAPGSVLLALLATILALGGGYVADLVRTDFGTVSVRDVTRLAPDGARQSGTVYLPAGATAEAPAPGVLAIHGYLNDRETQSPYAIELARRGYVVLALDQRGHGDAAPPAFGAGFGGPDGLDWLRSLPMVDPDRIVLSGHSMGGWAALIAADARPDDYASIVISGSSTGTFGAPEGTADAPRNLGLIYARYDEFSDLMWGAPSGATAPATEKMRTLFGTDDPVVPGVLYGDLEEGTARWLAQPEQTHPMNHVTPSGVAPVIEWVQRTVPAPNPLPSDDQLWHLKEIGTGMGLLGFFLMLIAAGGLWLRAPAFAPLRAPPAEAGGASGLGWWAGAAVLAVVPIVTYLPLQNAASDWLPVGPWFPQEITNGVAFWAVANAAIAFVLFLLWFLVAGRRAGFAGVGLRGGALRSLGLAAATVGSAYLLLALTRLAFGTDFRAWVVAVRPLDADRLVAAAAVLPFFVAFFLVLGLVLHGQLRSAGSDDDRGATVMNGVLLGAGFAGFLAWQYVPLFAGRPLPFGEPLLTIVAIQFLVLLPVAGLLSTVLFRATGRIWPGAFANGTWIALYVAMSQATHLAA